jgi:hypothetical protein
MAILTIGFRAEIHGLVNGALCSTSYVAPERACLNFMYTQRLPTPPSQNRARWGPGRAGLNNSALRARSSSALTE